jgi:hypothetical protein
LPARSLVLSFGAIGCFIGDRSELSGYGKSSGWPHRLLMFAASGLVAIAILVATGLASGAFAGERRDLAVADAAAGGCGGCRYVSYAVPSPYSDGSMYRAYIVDPYYADPENGAVTRHYSADPADASPHAHVVHRHVKRRQVSLRSHRHAVEPHMKTSYRQTKRLAARVKKLARRAPPLVGVRVASTKPSAFAAPASIVTPSRRAFSEAPVITMPVPNMVVVNGQRVEIVSPDEVNSIDLAADMSDLERVDGERAPPVQSALRVTRADQTAQVFSAIAGALTAALVGWFLIGWRRVRISRPGFMGSDSSA